MGVKDYDVFGRIRFCKEEQFTHLCMVIEAASARDALEKAKKFLMMYIGRIVRNMFSMMKIKIERN